MALRTGFYFDPISLEHETGNHPENAGRLTPAVLIKIKYSADIVVLL